MQEVIAVARADGAALGDPLVDMMMQITRREFPLTEPSMLQDVRAGKPPEVEALQGAVIARGRQHGVATPVLDTLTALLRAL
jgi:2-dehydropantoate 2-reductase